MPHNALYQAQGHETKAKRQNQIGNQVGDAQGRGVLRVGEEPFDLAVAKIGDDQRQNEKQRLHDNPADGLQALGELVVDDVHPDGRTFFDGNTECQVGNPDKHIAGEFLRPDRGTGAFNELRDDVAVDDLPCDEKSDGNNA